MSPKALFSLSISSSPLSLSHKLGNPIPYLIFKTPPHKPTLIICKTTDSETQRQRPISEARVSIPNVELEGTGAAATTRGQLFLEHQQSMAAAALVLDSEKKKKKKGKKSNTGPKLSSAVACCYGCGAPLQTSEVDAPGYVNLETYELKKKHRQLRTVLCGRCRLLSHGHMVTAVGGNGGYSGGKQFISAEELREKLSFLRHEKALIIKLVDIVDFNGSFLTRIRDLAGANPIILVVTKVDLLPKGTNFNCIGDWVVEATMKKKLNVLSVHLTSSKSLVGIVGVASEIQKEKKGRDVYILGSANVGKSAFINALLKMMAEKDPVAASAQKYKPIQSAVPGTTLGPIQIDAFLGGGKLFDTPGVHLHHRQAAVIHSEDLPSLAPRSRIRGQSFPVISHERKGEFKGNDLNGFSLFWGGLVRIDVLKVHPSTRLTFYGPKALQIHMVPTVDASDFYQRELGVLLTPPTRKRSADNWAGLEIVHQLHVKLEEDQKRPACDVAISGLGWITVEQPINKLLEDSDLSSPEVYTERLHLAVHVPKPVEIFVRPPIPVGKSGGEWYEYGDLTEKEEELRPKCNQTARYPMNISSSAHNSMEDEVLTCEICIEPMPENNKFKNENKCAHPFCLDCIAKYIEAKIGDHSTAGGEVSCPASNCDKFLDPLSCCQILPTRLFERWCDLLCESAVLRCADHESVYCPFPDCSTLVVNECGGNIARSECPNCKKFFCFRCKIPWHVGFGCNETEQLRDENDMLFVELVQRNKWMRCPCCKFHVMKTDGCRKITCRCGVFFCYACGKIKNACNCDRGNVPFLYHRAQRLMVLTIIYKLLFDGFFIGLMSGSGVGLYFIKGGREDCMYISVPIILFEMYLTFIYLTRYSIWLHWSRWRNDF